MMMVVPWPDGVSGICLGMIRVIVARLLVRPDEWRKPVGAGVRPDGRTFKLIDRHAERAQLAELVDAVRSGESLSLIHI